MTNEEYNKRLHDLTFTCGINQRYHQRLKWLWAVVDRTIRIAVGVLAVFGLVLTVPSIDRPTLGLWVAIISLIVAIALNIVPVGDWEKTHAELFRGWSDLRKDAEVEMMKACSFNTNEPVADHVADRLCDLTVKEHSLDADEPAPWRWLLTCCQGDELESRWGKGIRTFTDAEKERKKREDKPTSFSSAAGQG